MITEDQKKKYEEAAKEYADTCVPKEIYRTAAFVDFQKGAEHAHPIAHSEGKKEGWNEALDEVFNTIVERGSVIDHEYFHQLLQKLRK